MVLVFLKNTYPQSIVEVEILSSIIHHPLVWHFYTMRAKPFALQLATQLPADLAAAAEVCGKVKTWPQLVTEISQAEALPSGETDLTPLHQHSAQ